MNVGGRRRQDKMESGFNYFRKLGLRPRPVDSTDSHQPWTDHLDSTQQCLHAAKPLRAADALVTIAMLRKLNAIVSLYYRHGYTCILRIAGYTSFTCCNRTQSEKGTCDECQRS